MNEKKAERRFVFCAGSLSFTGVKAGSSRKLFFHSFKLNSIFSLKNFILTNFLIFVIISTLYKVGVPSCLVERKESARKWRHISVRRCLEGTDIRASSFYVGAYVR